MLWGKPVTNHNDRVNGFTLTTDSSDIPYCLFPGKEGKIFTGLHVTF